MKRYAFIDVQNTETTTLKVLGFETDHEKLFLYLKDRWQCEKVFFYPGIEYGDKERGKIFERISNSGGIVRIKYYFVYKNKDRIVTNNCLNCNTRVSYTINGNFTWKCNCDVEMTMDILDYTKEDAELLIFTADGDFECVIERAILNNSKVYLVSSARKTKINFKKSISRFATKLRDLIAKHPKDIVYIDINDWKDTIEKTSKMKTPSSI